MTELRPWPPQDYPEPESTSQPADPVQPEQIPPTPANIQPVIVSMHTNAEASDVVANLQHTAHLLRTAMAPHFAEFGLNDIRFTVLTILQDWEEGCPQTELADLLGQSESSISTLVERMRNSGLLYRMRSRTDRRKRLLKLTTAGQEMLQRIMQCHGRRMRALLQDISDEEIAQLSSTLKALVTGLSRQLESGNSYLQVAGSVESIAITPEESNVTGQWQSRAA